MPVHSIWLVDDDVDDCMLLEDAMEELGAAIPVICIRDSIYLINRLLEAAAMPDVLFLDVNMPMKDGLDCLAEIKQDERFNRVPVVMWSTSGQSETILKAYQLGARLFIKKPYNFNKLKLMLREILALNLQQPGTLEDFVMGK